VDRLSFEDATREISRRIESSTPTHVVFVNAAKVVKYARDRSLRNAMDNAGLLLADGVPVVWASRLLGVPLPGRVNGTDLMERLVALAAEHGHSVYFLGATDEVIASAITAFRRRYPALKVAGFHNGYFAPSDVPRLLDEINRSGAQMLFLGMGTPQKELWGDSVRAQLRVPICQGVGGSFDVVAGLVKRAPLWMQHCGAEWLYRLLQEPRRLARRYLETNTIFIWMVLRCLLYRPR
jgi:N-acetylglucosaminyldiphosphoundecaprenol N-acetyl-beta-D-mannosaminyltransferase